MLHIIDTSCCTRLIIIYIGSLLNKISFNGPREHFQTSYPLGQLFMLNSMLFLFGRATSASQSSFVFRSFEHSIRSHPVSSDSVQGHSFDVISKKLHGT